MKILSVEFLSMPRFRVNRKEDKIKKRRVIEKVAAYKYIPHHMHIISCRKCDILGTKELNSKPLFCISFCKGKIRHFVNKLYKSRSLWACHLKSFSVIENPKMK